MKHNTSTRNLPDPPVLALRTYTTTSPTGLKVRPRPPQRLLHTQAHGDALAALEHRLEGDRLLALEPRALDTQGTSGHVTSSRGARRGALDQDLVWDTQSFLLCLAGRAPRRFHLPALGI